MTGSIFSMRYQRQKLVLALFFILPIFFTGCPKKQQEEEQKKIKVNKSFPKIQQHGMILKVISTRSSYRLKDFNKTVKFQFANEGLSRVLISEWKTVEQDNLKIQYAPCPREGGADSLPENAWKDAPRATLKGDCPRYPLELDPKSSVIITLPLSFIKDLKKPGRYAIRGVMDLESMDVKSAPFELIIR